MSRIELQITSLDDLRTACKRLGFQFLQGQKTYQWYGRFVGDQPLPEGLTVEELGKCDHAIRVPDCTYEIGVVRKNGVYTLLWDSWHRGGLEKALGKNAGCLRQAYALARVEREAKRKGYRISEQKIEKGIRLVLTC